MLDLFTVCGLLYPVSVGLGWVLTPIGHFRAARFWFWVSIATTIVGSISWEASTELNITKIVVASCLGGAFIAIAGWGILFSQSQEKKEKKDPALLIPSDLPSPEWHLPASIKKPSDAFTVFLGSNVAALLGPGHQNVLKINEQVVLSMDLDEHGGLSITTDVFDDRDNLVARIVKNKYIKSNFAAYDERQDDSNLRVTDHLGNTVLDVSYLNPHALSISGLFRVPGSGYVLVANGVVMAHVKSNPNAPKGPGALFAF